MICRYIWIIQYIFSFFTRIITQIKCRSWSQNESWTEQLSGFFAMTSSAKQIGHSRPSTQAQGEADPHSLSSVLPAQPHKHPSNLWQSPRAAPAPSHQDTAAQMCPEPAHGLGTNSQHMDMRSACGSCAQSAPETNRFIFLFTVSGWEHPMSQQLLQHPLLQAGRHLVHWVKQPQFKQEILMVCSWAPHNRQE